MNEITRGIGKSTTKILQIALPFLQNTFHGWFDGWFDGSVGYHIKFVKKFVEKKC